MRFCSACATPLDSRIPAGDDRLRLVCPACNAIFYQNPRTVVGCVVEHEGRVLLCRRAIEPARGCWTPPAGFLEMGESTLEGAVRETLEEACADVEVIAPHSWLDLPHLGQTYALYRARLRGDSCAPGPESLEVRWFDVGALPWDELAFPVIHFALRLHAEDARAGRQALHLGVVRWKGAGSRFDPGNYDLQGHLRVPLGP